MQRLKVGLIGLGEVAQITHLPILVQLADCFEVTAICDISEQLVETIGNKYNITDRYTDMHELINSADVDCVFVLNSNEYHAECAVAAAQVGKHVFIEKPMCVTMREADEIIAARDAHGVQVMVGYMRRFAPAFTDAVERIRNLNEDIRYVTVRDIIGQNRLIIEQSNPVYRFDDIPEDAMDDRWNRSSQLVNEAIGDVPQIVANSYQLMCGLSSHDLSAMRELIGFPKRVKSAAHWKDGYYITALFEYDGFYASFETGVDEQRRFDAYLEVFTDHQQLRVQYDTPYIRHLPTTLTIKETIGEAYEERVIRPTYTDAYTIELLDFHECITTGKQPKTTAEDYKEDLRLFKMIADQLIPAKASNNA